MADSVIAQSARTSHLKQTGKIARVTNIVKANGRIRRDGNNLFFRRRGCRQGPVSLQREAFEISSWKALRKPRAPVFEKVIID